MFTRQSQLVHHRLIVPKVEVPWVGVGCQVLAWKHAHRLVAGNETLQQHFYLLILPNVLNLPALVVGELKTPRCISMIWHQLRTSNRLSPITYRPNPQPPIELRDRFIPHPLLPITSITSGSLALVFS
jgi:hypothetical protein